MTEIEKALQEFKRGRTKNELLLKEEEEVESMERPRRSQSKWLMKKSRTWKKTKWMKRR